MKKPVLNPTLTLTLTLGLPAKHSDVFHCLYKGKFLVCSRRARVGPASLAPTLDHLKLTKNLPLYNQCVWYSSRIVFHECNFYPELSTNPC